MISKLLGAVLCTLLLATAAVFAEGPQVVATTSFVFDVVQRIGGERLDLKLLIPIGSDPHAFEPSAADAALISQAQVVFAVGAHLEEALDPVLDSAGAHVVRLAEFVPLLRFEDDDAHHKDSEDDHEHDHHHGEYDPHIWLDPTRVSLWTHAIERTLSEIDPTHAGLYAQNAAAYREELARLDAWIVDQVQLVSPDDRRLVSDHRVLGYFARRYGFEVEGAVVPGLSTLAEPSARELAELIQTISVLGIRAVFVSTTVNPQLAEQIARDTGTKVVRLFTGSLSEADGSAASYLTMMRHNVASIVAALER
jgi:ABC-type Zn uptake system ZnuABC Zn-binding protein ZnuA